MNRYVENSDENGNLVIDVFDNQNFFRGRFNTVKEASNAFGGLITTKKKERKMRIATIKKFKLSGRVMSDSLNPTITAAGGASNAFHFNSKALELFKKHGVKSLNFGLKDGKDLLILFRKDTQGEIILEGRKNEAFFNHKKLSAIIHENAQVPIDVKVKFQILDLNLEHEDEGLLALKKV